MARLTSAWGGFEQNSNTSLMEFYDVGAGQTVVSTIVRSGTYSGRINGFSSGTRSGWAHRFSTSGLAVVYARAYLYIVTGPSGANTIMKLTSTDGTLATAAMVSVLLNSDLTLTLTDEDGTIGSSFALQTNTWYRIELEFNNSGAGATDIVGLYINGQSVVRSTTRDVSTTVQGFCFGANLATEAQTQGDWYFDDTAVNDNSGASQTSFPGSGKMAVLRPNAAGDSAATSGTFASIDEITPDDSTTDNIQLDVNPTNGRYNVDGPWVGKIKSTDTITLVAVGGRVSEETAGTSNYTLRIRSTSGGTETVSSSVDAGNATYRTNPSGTTPYALHCIAYNDPTTGSAWTPYGINSLMNMQIGAGTTDGTPDIFVCAMWALVEYVEDISGSMYIESFASGSVTATNTITVSSPNINSRENTMALVLVSAFDNSAAADRPVSTLTHNSDSLTFIRSDDEGATDDERTEAWYRLSPDTGTSNVVVTTTGTCNVITAHVFILGNVSQSGQMDANNGDTPNGINPQTISVTTVSDKSYTFSVCSLQTNSISSAGANQIVMGREDSSFVWSSFKVGTTPGSATHTYTTAGSDNSAISIVSVKPFTPPLLPVNSLPPVFSESGKNIPY